MVPFFPDSPQILILHLLVSVPTAFHVLLRKEDSRAAIGWIGLILLSPFAGAILYGMFGVNRVKRQAQRSLRRATPGALFPPNTAPPNKETAEEWKILMRAGYAVHPAPYLAGNQVNILVDGDEAYPRMLKAIEEAQSSIIFSSYIFDYDRIGRKFSHALGQAAQRGVDVRVLMDGYLLGFRWRITDWALRRRGVKTTRYLPYRPRFTNLRNHRKILSVDGKIAFLGGINIRAANLVEKNPRKPVRDLHFEITGPVIGQINDVFAADWNFATGETLSLPGWNEKADGPVTARTLPDGPDENYQKLEWTLLSAINVARHNIRVMTPYFTPGQALMSSLQAASLRGVAVEIVVPERSNIPFFDWAMQANFDKYLEFGIKIYLTPAPFDHSKLFIIDGIWSFIGSANWDARSLALKIEKKLECFDE
jgi:cardiolipin synthase